MPRFYVYALIDPRTKSPKYIGKGLSNRTEAHMRQAALLSDEARIVGVETEDVWASDKETIQEYTVSKEAWIAELLKRDYSHADIARVVARDLDEHAAFTLESFLIHSVYGKSSLLNLQAGHHAERFRSKGDWVAWVESAVVAGHDWYVYVLRDPRGGIDTTDGVFYVGKGRGSRLDMHFVDANRIHGELNRPGF